MSEVKRTVCDICGRTPEEAECFILHYHPCGHDACQNRHKTIHALAVKGACPVCGNGKDAYSR